MPANSSPLRLISFLILFGSFFQITFSQTRNPAAIFDFDGDGKTDPAVYLKIGDSSGIYIYYLLSSTEYRQQMGAFACNSTPAGSFFCKGLTAGDYDGDRKWDLSGYIENQEGIGHFRIIKSTTGVLEQISYGEPGDLPFPQDYDGDGKTDLTVVRRLSGNIIQWRILQSGNNQLRVENFGIGYKVAGDFDGDRKADLAVYNGGERAFYVLKSSDGRVHTEQFDETVVGYKPITADFDGDGKTDFAFVQDGTLNNLNPLIPRAKGKFISNNAVTRWFWKQSSDGVYKRDVFILRSTFNQAITTHGDFDGDGKTDIGYYIYDFKTPRYLPNYSHYFYIKKSSDNSFLNIFLGGKPTSYTMHFYYPLSDQLNRYGTPDYWHLFNPYRLP